MKKDLKKFIEKKCWNDDSFEFIFEEDEDISFLDDCIFNDELFAIYHKKEQLYEFIFLPLQRKLERSFEYTYLDKTFQLYYAKPTSVFEKLISHFNLKENEDITDRAYSLLQFNFFYKEDKPLNPTNFFIKGDFENIPFDEHISFFKHVNFMMTYYDRESPIIIIYNKKSNNQNEISVPCKSKKQNFPPTIYSKKLDTTLLELYDAARNAQSERLQYIFYFQILEYCSYYYIENDLKQKISNIIKSPDLLNSNKYSQKIIEIYSEYFKSNKDDKRMDRLISDLCDYDDIKEELEENGESFVNDTIFEGGLKVKGLFNKVTDIQNPSKDIFNSLRRNIELIRNVLVHARESRENVVIIPSQGNNHLLKPYLYLLRRIAEIVMIKFE